MIAIVVAADKNGVIGVKNRIPWRIRSDLVRLAGLTRSHTVIVGRKSFESMVGYYKKSGRDMPGAHYIIVTRNAQYKPESSKASIVLSIANALKTARDLGDDNTYVIGGGAIFTEALPYADRIYFTEVQTTVDAEPDAYFKKPSSPDWHVVEHEHHDQDDRDQFPTELTVFERV